MKRRAKDVGGMCANAEYVVLSAPSLGGSWFDDETSFGPQLQVGKRCGFSLETVDDSNVLNHGGQEEKILRGGDAIQASSHMLAITC